MPGDAAPISYVPYAEFVALEEKSPTKHEWLDGFVRELGEATPEYWPTGQHSAMKVAIIGKLRDQLCEKHYHIFDSAMEIRALATGFMTRPDVSVVCGWLEQDPNNPNAVTNPKIIVEVLSDSTEDYDRGEKFAHYQRIPSLAEYVLVSQHEPCIEVFRQTSRGKWELVEKAGAGQTVHLKSVECALSVDEVYANPLAET